MLKRILLYVVVCGLSIAAHAQSLGILKGQVADESGAVIPGAKVTAAGPNGIVKSATTIADGTYTLGGLAPGDWTVQATSPGLVQQSPSKVTISGGTQSLNLVLRVTLEKQEVTVQEQNNGVVSVDPSQNAGALVLKGSDLDSLSDDPDDLEQDLQALAGPAAGPNGGQIYIDGFTGGRLPPKESIREIRINQNPFSSEYDRLGFGRIEILTKPGTDKFRGMAMFNISDGEFNSRNPFLTPSQGQSFIMPDFQTRQYEGNLSGPLTKKSSFFLDYSRREIDDSAVVNAQIVNKATFAEEPFSTAAATPQRRSSFSPRMDYALTPNNTLMARYTYTSNDLADYGIGGFALPDRAYARNITQQTGQLTETAVINSKWINETRFQVMNDSIGQNGTGIPVISVAGAFSDGGSGVGLSSNWQRHYELQNYTSTVHGTHSIKFGVRVRSIQESDISRTNFGGTYSFSGMLDPVTGQQLTSLDVYQRTLMGVAGFGPSQFTLNVGNPLASVSQVDVGFFYQDDWRIKPNLTLSLGARYETQTNAHDWTDFAPRIGFAWAPKGGTSGGPFARPKFVIRGGAGVFYDRLAETLALQSVRFNGSNQQSIVVQDPTFFSQYMTVTPPPSILPAATQTAQRWQVDPNIHAPYVVQSAIGVERQLPGNTSVAVTYTNTRGVHELMTRDINAPLPGTYPLGHPESGVRPYGPVGDILNYESTGILNQNQIIVNANARINNKISLFGGYFFNHAMTNMGAGLPANDYNLSAEYGRANFDVRHRAMLAGSIVTKWDIRLNPFVIIQSGAPFDIVLPTLAGNNSYSLRPALAPAGASGPNILSMPGLGTFDLDPFLADGSVKPGEVILPRNYGQSPGSVTVNLRLSRTWAFGPERAAGAMSGGGGGGGDHGPGGDHGGGGGGPRGGGGGGGGARGMGMGMGGGMRGMFGGGGGNSSRRYQLTAGVNVRNVLNHTNFGPINGLVSSPTFGTSTTLAGGFGAEQSPLNNRRLEWQLRFTF